jgi:hypothetical protein
MMYSPVLRHCFLAYVSSNGQRAQQTVSPLNGISTVRLTYERQLDLSAIWTPPFVKVFSQCASRIVRVLPVEEVVLHVAISAKANAFFYLVLNNGEVALTRFSVDIKRLLLWVNVVKVENIQAALATFSARGFKRLHHVVILFPEFLLPSTVSNVMAFMILKYLVSLLPITLLNLFDCAFFAHSTYAILARLICIELRKWLVYAALVADH